MSQKNPRKFLKTLIASVFFFICLIPVHFLSEFLFLRLDPRTFCTMYDLQQMDDLQFVVVGNSMAAANLDPEVIDECLDTNSFLLTKSASLSYAATAMVEYMFELGHRPAQMVLMFDPVFQYSREDLSVQTTFTPYLSLKNRIDYTLATAEHDDLWLDRIFPLRSQRVLSLQELYLDLKCKFFPHLVYDTKAAVISGMYTYEGRGHTPYADFNKVESLEEGSHYLSPWGIDTLPENFITQVEKIAALCKEYNCDLIFTTTPLIRNKALADKALLSACNAMANYCAEKGYAYFNFTYTKPEYMPDYNQGGYYDKGDHLRGSLVPEFTRSVYCKVLKDYYDGKDVSHYFYTYDEWLNAVDFISDAWFVDSEENGLMTYTAYAHYGPQVQPLFQFVEVDENGNESILREYSAESDFTIAGDELNGIVRMYAMNQNNPAQEPLVYELH